MRRNLDQNIPFIDYLKKQKLNDNLCHLILNSISMVDYDATTKEVMPFSLDYRHRPCLRRVLSKRNDS